MKRIMRWLETRFSRPQVSIAWDQHSNHESVKPRGDDYKVDLPYGIQEPAPNAQMPDICADEQVAPAADLDILDQPSPVDDESAGYNPYDTGVLQNRPAAD